MKIKILKNLFIYFLLFTPISLGVISCSGNNKSSSKLQKEISSDFIPPITAVAALGQLSPSGEIRKLAAPISQYGSSPRIVEILVNEGDFVKKGDILAIFENAEKLIETLNEEDLADLIYKYGEERLSRKIARKIKMDLKENGKYSGTKELAYSIAGCFPPKQRYKKIHPATRTFQALRIAVNKEIEVLEKFLQVVPEWLLPGGIISVISFHSLEDRLVKSCFKNDQRLKNLTKKPITPSEQEVELNKRARSGKLRIAQLN